MNKKEYVLNQLESWRNALYAEIVNEYSEFADSGMDYLDSLYRAHLNARTYISTAKLSGQDLQHQIDIREDNLERMTEYLLEKTDAKNTKKIMGMYNRLAQADEYAYIIKNGSYFKQKYTIHCVYNMIEYTKITKRCDNIKKQSDNDKEDNLTK